MDATDKGLLNILQFSFPLTTTPWLTIAEQLSLSEREVIERISQLKEAGIVRQISPIFDSKKIGYHSTLAAFEVPEHLIDEVAKEVSSHKGVSHNYLRDNKLNLWFTVTIPQEHSLEDEIKQIAQNLQIDNWFYLPSEKTYNIGFKLNMQEGEQVPKATPLIDRSHASLEYDKAFIAAVQHDLPLLTRPYEAISHELAMSQEDIIAQLQNYIAVGYIRRVAAVLIPTKAGFTHNVMVGWETENDAQSDALGAYAANLEKVSHSYKRKRHPQWPVSVYTMIHGQTQDDIEAVIADIKSAHSPIKSVSLKTVREFKKIRVLYYAE